MRSHRLALALIAALTSGPAMTQCDLTWHAGELPGTNSRVEATAAWDPDGAGPASTQLVAGGAFDAVGAVPCTLVAAFDPTPSHWRALGAPLVGEAVHALLPLPNGDLIVAGRFHCPSVPGTYNIARFDGTDWHAMRGGVGGRVLDLALHPSGDILAVGDFVMASGVQVHGVARWDGQTWRALGSGVPSGRALAVAVLTTGQVAIGGAFSSVGGAAAQNIALWNGSSWGPLGSGMGAGTTTATPVVEDLAVMPNGDLVAGGQFYSAGGVAARHLARWNGSTWQAMDDPLRPVGALRVLQNGDVAFCLGSLTGVQVWSAATGTLYDIGASLVDRTRAATITELDNGEIYVGGQFKKFAGRPAYNLAGYDGTTWFATAPGQPPDGEITDLLALPNGDVMVRGTFTEIGGVRADGMALWDGNTWSSSSNTPAPLYRQPAWTVLQNGDVAMPVWFPVSGIARWNGSTWGMTAPLPHRISIATPILALAELANGDLVAGGHFSLPSAPLINLARWNGTAWAPFGTGANGPIRVLLEARNGDLIAGGSFSAIGGQSASGLARWNGSTWSPIGTEAGVWSAIVENDNGDLIACGAPASGTNSAFRRGIARWDGQRWHDLDQGLYPIPSGLVALPGGDVIATGSLLIMNGAVACNGIARWNGSTWQPVGTGVNGAFDGIQCVARRRDGDLVVGGQFTTAGRLGAVNFASLVPDCPADVQVHGTWCASSAGPLEFQAEAMAWAGGVYRATCTGIPNTGITFALHGLRVSATALAARWASQPGCALWVTPLATHWLPANHGRAALTFAVPRDLGLIGITLTQQILHAEPVTGPQAFVLSSSNALRATIGSY